MHTGLACAVYITVQSLIPLSLITSYGLNEKKMGLWLFGQGGANRVKERGSERLDPFGLSLSLSAIIKNKSVFLES